MLDVLAHPDLSHEFVLVSVHACELSHMSKHILQTISQLEGVHITQSVLHMTVNHQLRQTQNLTTQVESIPETRLLTFLQYYKPTFCKSCN